MSFDVPISAVGTNFTLSFAFEETLPDEDEGEEQNEQTLNLLKSEEYRVEITIVSPAGTSNSAFIEGILQSNFDAESELKRRYKFDEALTNSTSEKLSVEVKEPSIDGFIKLLFTRQVAVISNLTDWSSENEGAENILIQLDLSEETSEKLEDQDLRIDLSWRVESIANFTTGR